MRNIVLIITLFPEKINTFTQLFVAAPQIRKFFQKNLENFYQKAFFLFEIPQKAVIIYAYKKEHRLRRIILEDYYEH